LVALAPINHQRVAKRHKILHKWVGEARRKSQELGYRFVNEKDGDRARVGVPERKREKKERMWHKYRRKTSFSTLAEELVEKQSGVPGLGHFKIRMGGNIENVLKKTNSESLWDSTRCSHRRI